MAFVEAWDETKPSGTRDRSLGDDDIREFKRAIRERLEVDHLFYEDESGHSDVGCHAQVTLPERVAPSLIANTGIVYTKDVAGKTELFYMDASGNEVQITNNGVLPVLGSESWRSGDIIFSSSTSTPTGWADVSATYNDKFIRISSGDPLTTGGSDTHDHGAATGSHVLTEAEIPAHTHTMALYWGEGGNWPSQPSASYNNSLSGGSATTASTGSGAGHTHTLASADNIPAYIKLRMYSKN